jgi:N-acetylneuraminic acid mutarotase
MLVAVSYSGFATLPDGRVLVAGGFLGAANPAVVSSSQIYDPSNGKWSVAASMHWPRAGFEAVLLGDGNVLVMGGEAAFGNVTNTAEIYNPSTNSWTMTGSMALPRIDHQAVLLNDGRVFVVGGTLVNGSSEAEIYNPATGSWTSTPPQPFPRQDMLVVKLNDGNVLVAGGASKTAPTTLSEIYNPSTNTWTQTGSLNEPRSDGGGVLLKNGDVLFAGGYIIYNGSAPTVDDLYTAELYNATTSKWTTTGDMASPRGEIIGTTMLLNNGDVLVAGGNLQPETGLPSSELYSPTTGVWGPGGNMSVSRGSGAMAVLLKDGGVLTFGGLLPHACAYCGAIALRGQNTATASADIYTPG